MASDRNPYPTADEIADRALELFELSDHRASMPRCWEEAETELLNPAADAVIGLCSTKNRSSKSRRSRPRDGSGG